MVAGVGLLLLLPLLALGGGRCPPSAWRQAVPSTLVAAIREATLVPRGRSL